MLKEDRKEDQGWEPYLSPILLLKHCGEFINPEKLSLKDQEECASLLLCFQHTKWLYESVTPRNFLVQPRKPTKLPSLFSRRFDLAEEKQAEELEALKMFKKLDSTMNVMLPDGQGPFIFSNMHRH
ncbi:hypothetical protein J3R83DRAFT_11803 [Lanmaoa asiatica]|nr:hypothetical protein J3R83DRAFT_11803 [Lanmaoa asiatica]